MNKAKAIVGNVLTEFGMIDSLLRSIYRQCKSIDPVHSIVKDDELDKCFFKFLDSNPEFALPTKIKNYKCQDGADIHLQDLVQKMREVRNITAHQTWSLVTGLSSFPIEAHSQAADSYIGSINDLEKRWRFYSDQFFPIFERWNSGGFDDLG